MFKKLYIKRFSALCFTIILALGLTALAVQSSQAAGPNLVTAQLLYKVVCSTNCAYTGTTTLQSYQGSGVPTLATSTGAGAVLGTTTLAYGSTDLAGRITLVTGSGPAANSQIFTFTSASSSASFCILKPFGTTTSKLYGATSTIMQSVSTTTFSVWSGSIGLTSTTTYAWNYLCN